MVDSRRRFLILFGLANAGGVVAYAPLLTLLLPEKISGLAGETRIEWLGAITFFGAIAASVGNIAFGWASDVWGSRRAWTGAGLFLTLGSYAFLHFASSEAEIIVAIIVFQLVLNMLLSPLTAWAADTVPDSEKGLLGGLLAAAPPIGALAGVIATLPGMSAQWLQLGVVCLLILVLVMPLLLVQAPPELEVTPVQPRRTVKLRVDFGLLWFARLLVQIAGAILFAFLLYYFESLPVPETQAQVALISAVTLACAFPITLAVGRWSDRLGPRKPFLIAAALVAAVGLGLMAVEAGTVQSILGYGIFGCATAVYLSLHSAYSMQLLPSPQRRGRDMGVLNLTNTLPSIVAPLLAIWLVPGRGFSLLLTVLAAMLVLSAAFVAMVRTDQQSA
jgi:MFS family permease